MATASIDAAMRAAGAAIVATGFKAPPAAAMQPWFTWDVNGGRGALFPSKYRIVSLINDKPVYSNDFSVAAYLNFAKVRLRFMQGFGAVSHRRRGRDGDASVARR